MKKLAIIGLAFLLIGTTGCSKNKNSGESTTLPSATPSVTTSTPNTESVIVPEDKEPTETPKSSEVVITESTIMGSFIEETSNSPTSLVFNEDGTFTSNVNVCTGMLDITGTYRIDEDTVSLFIPEETGIYYIDNDQPFYFTISDKTLKYKYEPTFSCADVDTYIPQ